MKKIVSILIPVYNEEKNIPLLISRLRQIMNSEKCECIFIDDGSTDGTLTALREGAASSVENFNVRYISFSRNFGHQNALKAGFDSATGDCLITMDGDMQHPPELLPKMISLWRNGYDIIHTIRETEDAPDTSEGSRPSFFKRLSSDMFYKIFSAVTGVPMRRGMADFRLMDKRVAGVCKSLKGDVFFWRGFISWLNFNQISLTYTAGKRHSGKSKYSIKKMFSLAWKGISLFSTLPIRIAWICGILGISTSIIYSIYILYAKFFGHSVSGWSSLMLLTGLLGSINLFILGIVGDYLYKILNTTSGKPPYVIKESSDDDQNL
ncbi:glycosyltransferase family 2 protein [uncultured Desulfovibrio sp.]|uniref:glycosyltransferase family 2 protein n=1 Tax=uncultured Desulfovibrio sp. TaxID=167968 RepID=UPI002803A9A6|nr:glycosyltransferase family 2 protein [uncultured Desulfovibrio sp.]